MRSHAKSNLIPFLVVLAGLLALPAVAQASLTFVRGVSHPAVYVANDNGKGARKVDAGRSPRITPDGFSVVYLHEGAGHSQEMKLAPVDGKAAPITLMNGWRETFYLAISPDSMTIAALRGGELGKRKLVLIDVQTGRQRVVATGYFGGFSFSPNGAQLVYSKAASERYPPKTDVYRVPTLGGKTVALTRDHRSGDPLWGPTGKIAFVKYLDANKRQYGPKTEIYLMNSNGGGVKRLTHTKVDPLLTGLFPTDWSGNGSRLLAEFEGQDTSYAVTVNPRTGAQQPVYKAAEAGFVGTALSNDGKLVLGFTGGFEPGPNHDVATAPYTGGKPKTLVASAYEPDWNK